MIKNRYSSVRYVSDRQSLRFGKVGSFQHCVPLHPLKGWFPLLSLNQDLLLSSTNANLKNTCFLVGVKKRGQ